MRPWVSHGDPGLPAAVIAHGTGSSPDFIRRCFADPLASVGLRLVTYPLRGHSGDPAHPDREGIAIRSHIRDLADVVDRCGARVVGGLSLGAHAAALWAYGLTPAHRPDGLLLCLPAWVGPANDVALANAAQADELDRIGLPATLARISAGSLRWVTDEVAASWPTHDPAGFTAALRGIAVSAAPTEAELAQLDAPTGVVGVLGDGLHPADVAARWASALPHSALRCLTLQDWGAARSAVGVRAVEALRAAGWVSELR